MRRLTTGTRNLSITTDLTQVSRYQSRSCRVCCRVGRTFLERQLSHYKNTLIQRQPCSLRGNEHTAGTLKEVVSESDWPCSDMVFLFGQRQSLLDARLLRIPSSPWSKAKQNPARGSGSTPRQARNVQTGLYGGQTFHAWSERSRSMSCRFPRK